LLDTHEKLEGSRARIWTNKSN